MLAPHRLGIQGDDGQARVRFYCQLADTAWGILVPQTPGLGSVPSGEIPCDIWTLARSDVFLDEKPCYLPIPCRREDWSRHAQAVRRLCLRAIEERRRNRRYMVWLQHHIRAYFGQPVDVVGRMELRTSPTSDLDRSGSRDGHGDARIRVPRASSIHRARV